MLISRKDILVRQMVSYYDDETGVVSSYSTIKPKNVYWEFIIRLAVFARTGCRRRWYRFSYELLGIICHTANQLKKVGVTRHKVFRD